MTYTKAVLEVEFFDVEDVITTSLVVPQPDPAPQPQPDLAPQPDPAPQPAPEPTIPDVPLFEEE